MAEKMAGFAGPFDFLNVDVALHFFKQSNDDVVKAQPLSSTNLSGPMPKRAAAFGTK